MDVELVNWRGIVGAPSITADQRKALAMAVDKAVKSADALKQDSVDVGFVAIDPVRGEGIAFTSPYVLIEGCYLVRQDSPITGNEQVDMPGVHVAVGKGSAYDLYLTRELKRAGIVRESLGRHGIEGASVAPPRR